MIVELHKGPFYWTIVTWEKKLTEVWKNIIVLDWASQGHSLNISLNISWAAAMFPQRMFLEEEWETKGQKSRLEEG